VRQLPSCCTGLTVSRLQVTLVPVPGLTDVSSSAVRAALASGGDVAHALHPDVAQHIRAHALYTSAPPPPP
jgi:hypothetical protein